MLLPLIPAFLAVLALLTFAFWRLRIPRDLSQEGIDDHASTLAYDQVSHWPLFSTIRFYVIRQLSGLKPQGVLMDAGCGPGYLALAMARKFPQTKILGVDISEEMLKLATTNASFQLAPPQVYFQKADLQQLPLEADCLDLVFSTLSLHHWPDPSQVLSEIHRVLKPGGRFLIFDLRRDMPNLLFYLIRFGQRFLAPPPIRRVNGGVGSVWSSLNTKEMRLLLSTSPFSGWQVQRGWGWAYLRGQK
jgi:ubiquinone/menaquinone biosynthesis C-methylase UbiE